MSALDLTFRLFKLIVNGYFPYSFYKLNLKLGRETYIGVNYI